MAKISALTLLGATPANDDEFVILDVSDTTQGANGSTKGLVASRVARTGAENTFTGAQAITDTNGARDSLVVTNTQAGVSARSSLVCIGDGVTVSLMARSDLSTFNPGVGQLATVGGDLLINVGNGVSGQAKFTTGGIEPATDDALDLGTISKRWDDIFATNATIQTSDANLKTDIEDSDIGWDFIRSLRPVRYRWAEQVTTDSETGEEIVKPAGTRLHYGLIAQEVKAVMDAQGIADFAGYIYDKNSGRHGLRYAELWAPLIAAIQRGADIIEAQAAQIEALTARVEALEGAE